MIEFQKLDSKEKLKDCGFGKEPQSVLFNIKYFEYSYEVETLNIVEISGDFRNYLLSGIKAIKIFPLFNIKKYDLCRAGQENFYS